MKIKWSPRLSKDKLLRLYKSNAMRIADHDLLQEVAVTLYLRCKSIIAVHDAHYNQKVRCPSCFDNGNENYIDFPRGLKSKERSYYIFHCSDCGCSFSWSDFRKSHSREQLNIGGAGDAFSRFIEQYERNLDDTSLMLEVDRLIHEFHCGLKKDGVTLSRWRIAGANLIESETTTETIEFLDKLAYDVGEDEKLKESAQEWRERLNK